MFNYFSSVQLSTIIFSLLRLHFRLKRSRSLEVRMVKTIVNALPPPTHPQGCVQIKLLGAWGAVDPPQRMCALHCVCIYTAGGGSGPTPKDVHTLLGVSGPTRQRMCTDSWRSARPVHVRGGHRSPVLHPPNRFPRVTRLPLLGDRNVSTEFLHCPALGARRVLT